MSNLTVNQAVAGLQVAEDADGGDGEHAAEAEDEAAEAVVNAGGALAHPGVVEGGEDGERVEADAAEEVHRGQVDAQQLRAHQLPPAVVADDQNQPVTQDGQQNWARRRERDPHFWTFALEMIITQISDVDRRASSLWILIININFHKKVLIGLALLPLIHQRTSYQPLIIELIM